MKHDLIIFDCDGVLIDSEYLSNQIEVEALCHLGYPITLDKYLDIALGRTSDEVETRLFEQCGIRLPNGFWQTICQRQKKEFVAKLTPIAGVRDLIQNLHVPCCVASNSDAERLALTLSVTGLFPLLEGRIFGRECVKRGKPEPDIFLYASEKMGIAPSKCLVIEDTIHGIKAAQAAGMEVWAFCGGRHFNPSRKEKLRHSGVCHIFEDMKEILGRFKDIMVTCN